MQPQPSPPPPPTPPTPPAQQRQQQQNSQDQRNPPPSDTDVMTFLLLGVIFVAFATIFLLSSFSTNGSYSVLHQVPEGHVGAYWRGGALLKSISNPGFHLKLPLITQFEPIQVTIQTDLVRDIPCGTKGGVMISFDKIEVVNRLNKGYVYDTLLNYGVNYDKTWIYDKIHHEINQFCSSHFLQQVYIDMFDQECLELFKRFGEEIIFVIGGVLFLAGEREILHQFSKIMQEGSNAKKIGSLSPFIHLLEIDDKMKEALQMDCTQYAPGVEIISVRVTKPNIPTAIKRNFELMEVERTKALVSMEAQKVAEKEAETQKKVALSEAEKNAQVSKILMEQKLMEKDSLKQQDAIENEMYLAREKSQADASFYRVMKEAEANKLKLTPEFLELKFIEAIANNSKIFFGEKVPNMIFDQRLLGNFLNGFNKQDL